MITENNNGETVSINVNNKALSFDVDIYNAELKALVDAYNGNQSDENLAAILAQIDLSTDVNRTTLLLNGLVKFYVNKNEYYFQDDDVNRYPLTEDIVLTLEVIDEKHGDIKPIVNFLKLLRRNKNYSPAFAEAALDVIYSSFTSDEIYSKLVNKGYYSEIAYSQSKVNKFTLTNEGLVVAYKKADFKKHKFDKLTGECIDRFPFVFDEETGDKIVTYPTNIDEYKIFLTSKKIDNLQTRKEENKYVKVGSIVDQRKGQVGFEEDEQTLIYKGATIANEPTFVKVLIHPQFITKFRKEYDSIYTPVFYITNFYKDGKEIKANEVIDQQPLIKMANADWKQIVSDRKAAVEKVKVEGDQIISFQETM